MADQGKWERASLTSALKERLIGYKAHATFGELKKKNLPQFLEVYLDNQVRKCFREERPIQIRASRRFATDQSEVQSLWRELKQSVLAGTVFTGEEISRMIDVAINLQLDFIIRPHKALNEMIFRNTSTRSKAEALDILRRFSGHRLSLARLDELISEYPTSDISQEAFSELLDSSFTDLAPDDRVEHLQADFEALIAFLRQATGDAEIALDRSLVLRMLKERKQNGVDKLTQSPGFQDKERWELDELRQLLVELNQQQAQDEEAAADEEASPGEAERDDDATLEAEATAEASPAIQQDEAQVVAEPPPPQLEAPDSPVVAPGPLTIEMAADDDVPAEPEAEPVAEAAAKPKPQAPSAPTRSPRRRQFPEDLMSVPLMVRRENIEAQPPGPYPPLKSLLNRKDRKLILRRVFKKDEQALEAFVNQIDDVDLWKDAKVLIDRELEDRGVRPFSSEATRLGDIVFKRYFGS